LRPSRSRSRPKRISAIRPQGKDNIVDAKNKLEEAKKKLEELLRQLREEEQAALLATLIQRCKEMLKMQQAVLKGTRTWPAPSTTPRTSSDQPAHAGLAEPVRRRKEDRRGGDKAIELLEAEGSGQAFAEILNQIREDMKARVPRLAATPSIPARSPRPSSRTSAIRSMK